MQEMLSSILVEERLACLLFHCSYTNMYHHGHHIYIDSTISLYTVILCAIAQGDKVLAT